MKIETLKAEFEKTECFKRLEHVAQYTFFEFGAYIKRTDVPADIEKKCGKLITALLFSWSAWKEAKAQTVPKWTSVKNKLPSESDLVLGISTTKLAKFNVYQVVALDEFDDCEITHWMHLPQAPKAQEPSND